MEWKSLLFSESVVKRKWALKDIENFFLTSQCKASNIIKIAFKSTQEIEDLPMQKLQHKVKEYFVNQLTLTSIECLTRKVEFR